MTNFMLENKYLETAVQKGGILGVSGCLQHTGALTQIIREENENRGNLAVLWLDLTNGYGSILHTLITKTMQSYHMPGKTQRILQGYFDEFKMEFTFGDYTTDW